MASDKHGSDIETRLRWWLLLGAWLCIVFLAGVVPLYNDEETCLFVRSQREQQFQDLKHTLQVMGRLGHSSSLSSPELTLHNSCPQDFVLIYLLENDRLLSPAVNQLKLECQIDLCTIAQAFLTLFDGEEEEVETYWLFSKFARKWESQQQHVSFLVSNKIFLIVRLRNNMTLIVGLACLVLKWKYFLL